MYVHICMCIQIQILATDIGIDMCMYIYIYVHTYIHVCIYVYILLTAVYGCTVIQIQELYSIRRIFSIGVLGSFQGLCELESS